MLRKTLFFSKGAYLSRRHTQLRVEFADPLLEERTIPIEDIGVVVLEDPQITITHALLQALMAEGVAVITCNEHFMPDAALLPLAGHHLHQVRLRHQVEASKPLRKQLWKFTVQAKLASQVAVLQFIGQPAAPLLHWRTHVRSGDPDNLEARGAAYYWQKLFASERGFRRNAEGAFPNNWLNYGYALLRATVARAIVGAGLHPAIGLFHKNQYNAYTLADDLMEPYRPYIDKFVWDYVHELDWGHTPEELSREDKAILLQIPALVVPMGDEQMPLMVAAQRTAVSLTRCFAGEDKKIRYPDGEPL